MRKVWVLQHAGPENCGLLEGLLDEEGVTFQYVRTFQGEKVPSSMEEAQGLIVMGGPMSVTQQNLYPFLGAEIGLIEQSLKAKKPILGICLGSQLLAAALGADVTPNSQKEIGWYPVTLTPEGKADPLLVGVPPSFHAFHWHGEIFEVPRAGISLAYSQRTSHQAFRHGENAYGFLFHMEVTEEIVHAMTQSFARELTEGKISTVALFKETIQNLPSLHQIGMIVFTRWAQLLML